MLEIRSRKVGNSVSIILPKSLNIQVDQAFIITKTHNGSLVLTPKVENPYKQNKKINMSDPEGDYLEERASEEWED